ncbi:metallophosphoesterase [Lachnospiraceae bacterium ZAX-1]
MYQTASNMNYILLFLVPLFVLSALLAYVKWQRIELKKFMVSEYNIASSKIKKTVNLVVLADLHGFEYGTENAALLNEIRKCAPNIILIAGDMIISRYVQTFATAQQTMAKLVEIAPVYYCFGNHETRAAMQTASVYTEFSAYIERVQALGVHILNNQNDVVALGENTVALAGLELDLHYYQRHVQTQMEHSYLDTNLQKANAEAFQILLAHNPSYSEQYATWGADLTFCGHNHGGLIRIPGIGSLISPQFILFPKYDAGLYHINENNVIVSRGMGTHTFHIRINNRAQLLFVQIHPKTESKASE